MKSCKDIVVLVERNLDKGVSRSERMRMRTHFMMCKACKGYAAQSTKLHQLLKRRVLKRTEEGLTNEERASIKNTVIERLNKGQ